MAHAAEAHAPEAHGHHDHQHEHYDPGFWRKWVFSTDHKMIGIQYTVTGLAFLLFGFGLMMVMRWSIANGERPFPEAIGGLLHWFFGNDVFSWNPSYKTPGTEIIEKGWMLTTQGYNVFGAMHGTIMV